MKRAERLHGPGGAGVGARLLGGLMRAVSLLTPGTDGLEAEADNGCMIAESDTTQDPCITVPSGPGVGVILTAMWTSGAACTFLGFFVGGWSYFSTFGGRCIDALLRDYVSVSFYLPHSMTLTHHVFCP